MTTTKEAATDLNDVDPREYCKMRYSAPPECCKCGNCQLVPPARLVQWSDTIERLDEEADALRARVAELEGALKDAIPYVEALHSNLPLGQARRSVLAKIDIFRAALGRAGQ